MHGLHGVWCSFQGWDVGTLGNTVSEFVTQDSKQASTIHPTHPVRLVVCMSEPQCCACRLVHKWINKS